MKKIMLLLFVISLFLIMNPAGVNAVCSGKCGDVQSGCGGGGCAANSRYVCKCFNCVCMSNPNPPPLNKSTCLNYGGCSCKKDISCGGGCSPNCSGKNCGPNGCGGSCGTCGSGVCGASGVCCTNTAPSAPTLTTPANGAQLRKGVASTFSWNPPASWGTNCTGNVNSYNKCISSNQVSCDLVTGTNGALTTFSYTPAAMDTLVTWNATATNGVLSTTAASRSFCVEGFVSTSTTYVSAWSACNATTHKRTRTCREDCGTDDCTAFVASNPLIQDCLGAVRGTVFDASNYSACPAFDPLTGYLTGLPAGLGAPTRTFGFTDQSLVPPHPWAPLSATSTNGIGNYSISVYAPSSYVYDFSVLSDIYVTSGGPKLVCNSTVATVPSSPVGCTTQPCSLVNNMSFGFWRRYGGWWQVVGGSVHAQTDIKSEVPASLLTEQSLIVPDTTAGNRLGFLSYGVTRPSDIFGTNPNAKASSSLWEKQSAYGGPVYDWSFYDVRFNGFTTTAWDGGAVTYDDGGNGYQIFETGSSVNNFSYSPTGTQKVIFAVNGDVTVTSNITVPSGAFLAIIASGTITFDQAVNNADGWYVASDISVPCIDLDANGCDQTDTQFVGNGSFVGWNSIELSRDQGTGNNSAPSEKFSYREDIYNNAPDPMKIYTKVFKPFVP